MTTFDPSKATVGVHARKNFNLSPDVEFSTVIADGDGEAVLVGWEPDEEEPPAFIHKEAASPKKETVFSDDFVNPIVLAREADTQWGPDWITWEPETIIQTADLDRLNLSRINQDKLMAIKVLFKTPDFHDSWRVFEKVCIAFAGRIVDWGFPQPVRVHEMAAAVAIVKEHIVDIDFNDDVKAYVAGSALRDGYLLLPDVLKFAEFEFSKELLFKMGDEAIARQNDLLTKINDVSTDNLSDEDSIQLLRIVRVQRHVASVLSEI